MAFPKDGVVVAPAIEPSDYGLFAIAKPAATTLADEDRWIRTFAQEWDTSIYSAKNWDDTDTTSASIASDATPTRFTQIKPFFIEVEEQISTFGYTALDRFERISRQIKGITQKAVEQELWDGAVREGESHDNIALSASTATILNSGTALNVMRALALLDFKIGSTSPCGEQGVIHMTRDVASLLSSNYMLFHTADGRLETISGTPIIVGSGYSGTGPTGATGATATDGNKWMYGTGSVRTYVGKVDVVNDSNGQAYDVSGNQNDMKLKAIRPAAVYFDTTIHLAVRVDLTV
jgi:hypothetical protein